MRSSDFVRRFEKKKKRQRFIIPLNRRKIITEDSPQLVLPAPGKMLDVESKMGAKFTMKVHNCPTWVPKNNSGTYQVTLIWRESYYTACWDKAIRKWMLITAPDTDVNEVDNG